MSFNSMLKNNFNTERLTVIADTNKKDYQAHLTNQAGMLQPFGEKEMIGGEKLGQLFRLFTTRIDLKVADRVIVSEVNYTVKSVKDFNYGACPHLEAILAKQ